MVIFIFSLALLSSIVGEYHILVTKRRERRASSQRFVTGSAIDILKIQFRYASSHLQHPK